MSSRVDSFGMVAVGAMFFGGLILLWCLVPALPCFMEASPGVLIPPTWRPYGALAGGAVALLGLVGALVLSLVSRWQSSSTPPGGSSTP